MTEKDDDDDDGFLDWIKDKIKSFEDKQIDKIEKNIAKVIAKFLVDLMEDMMELSLAELKRINKVMHTFSQWLDNESQRYSLSSQSTCSM